MLSLISALIMSSFTWASDCPNLKLELQAMRKAQSQIIESLIENHEKMSSVLAANATGPRNASEMLSIARAFEFRAAQAHKTADHLDDATEDLISRIAKCLKK